MRLQIWILGASFFVFGVLAWAFMRQFSLAYLGLMGFGVAFFIVGFLGSK